MCSIGLQDYLRHYLNKTGYRTISYVRFSVSTQLKIPSLAIISISLPLELLREIGDGNADVSLGFDTNTAFIFDILESIVMEGCGIKLIFQKNILVPPF